MENWIGSVVGKMHTNRISQNELAKCLGIRRDYLNKILNGKCTPNGAREKIENAITAIISNRK